MCPLSRRYHIPTFLSLFLFLIGSSGAQAPAAGTWESIFAVKNATCPKFICVDVKKQGLGDMLSRIFSGMASAYLSHTTLIFLSDSWTGSVHYSKGYHHVFENELGVPMSKFLLLKDAVKQFNPSILSGVLFPDKSIFDPTFANSMPCNSVIHMADLNTCTVAGVQNAWCFSYITSSIQSIIRPFFDESILMREAKALERIIVYPEYFKLSHLNVVWHVRTGDLCLRCTNATFYENIERYLSSAIGKLPRKNIVVHEAEKGTAKVPKLFENIPNTVFHINDDISLAVQMFLNCDILITTGSSFVNHVALFTPLFRPIVLQASDKDAVKQYHDDFGHRQVNLKLVRDRYAIIEGRAIRIDDDGNIIQYPPEDLFVLVSKSDILARLSKYR
jgi:hypothetical protein